MKKNVMLKIAAVLLVAVLLSTCAISATFAKYTTGVKDVYSDSARVAKWGVEVDTTANSTVNLFSDKYADGAMSALSTGDLVVAPGTEGSISLDSVVSGTPEVSGEIQYTVKVTYTGFAKGCPVEVKVGTATVDPATAVEGVATVTVPAASFEPGDDLATKDALDISWKWDFFDTADQDVIDTEYGNNPKANTIKIDVSVVVVQTQDLVEAGKI